MRKLQLRPDDELSNNKTLLVRRDELSDLQSAKFPGGGIPVITDHADYWRAGTPPADSPIAGKAIVLHGSFHWEVVSWGGVPHLIARKP